LFSSVKLADKKALREGGRFRMEPVNGFEPLTY
jgi:hypothetical protein